MITKEEIQESRYICGEAKFFDLNTEEFRIICHMLTMLPRCLDELEEKDKFIESFKQSMLYYKADSELIREDWDKQNIKIAKLEEALRFYADKSNWHSTWILSPMIQAAQSDHDIAFVPKGNDWDKENGFDRAREALGEG